MCCVVLCVWCLFVGWLRLESLPLRVVLGALGSLSLITIHTIYSVAIRALVDCNGSCLPL
jgi:hypothetical protein